MKWGRLAIAAFGLAAILGCRVKDGMPIRETKVDGYNVSIGINNIGRKILIKQPKQSGTSAVPRMYALDIDNDGRFDEINLGHVPKGHALEQKANLTELERMYQEALRKTGGEER